MSFRELHAGTSGPLLLPNAWDVPSALAFVEAGFPAVGTTSFGVASAQGLPDGRRVTREANVALAAQLARLPVYVSVDIEDGYSDDPEEVAEYVALLKADGVNIEDSTGEKLVPPASHAAKVAAIKRVCPDVFVNARVDTYWLGQNADPEHTLARAEAYESAGADGVFVPGATDEDLLRTLAQSTGLPVNVLVVPGLSLERLGELGIRRVSTGSLPYRAAVHAATAVVTAVRDGGETPPADPYPLLQERLVRYAAH